MFVSYHVVGDNEVKRDLVISQRPSVLQQGPVSLRAHNVLIATWADQVFGAQAIGDIHRDMLYVVECTPCALEKNVHWLLC